MFNADQINFQIKKVAKELRIADVNRVRIILTIERAIARLVNSPFLKERLIFGGGSNQYVSFPRQALHSIHGISITSWSEIRDSNS